MILIDPVVMHDKSALNSPGDRMVRTGSDVFHPIFLMLLIKAGGQ